ncbi:hypothetical protein [Bacillus massiliglaciei]|uniref:hypothetical protein n=1 Tax=Bacillus massiliglaciei TaxID=1816693 RepID=UPI0018FE155F|nr:hypothetical protein [Bacillus massiliglaciei]
MQQDEQAKRTSGTLKSEDLTAHAKKVKQEIQKDVSEGRGAMTSREAGAMRE